MDFCPSGMPRDYSQPCAQGSLPAKLEQVHVVWSIEPQLLVGKVCTQPFELSPALPWFLPVVGQLLPYVYNHLEGSAFISLTSDKIDTQGRVGTCPQGITAGA